MRQGLVTFGIILLVLGVGMLFLNSYVFTKTTTQPGPFGIGQTQNTQGVSYGIPNGLAWFAIVVGGLVALVGFAYDPVSRHVTVRK